MSNTFNEHFLEISHPVLLYSTQHAPRSHLCARTRRTAPELRPRSLPITSTYDPTRHARSHTSSSSRTQYDCTVVRAPDARSHTNPHVLDPKRPAVPRKARSLPTTYGHLHSVLVFAQIAHARSHTSSIPHVPPCPVSALTPDYVRPPPLRPLVFAQISHARPRATPKGPRHTTATRATARTELTIPITRPLHYTSRPPLFPCLSTRGGNTPCEDKLFFLLKSQPLARCAPLLHSNIHARSTARGCPGDLRQPAADLAHDPSHPMHHFSSAGPHNYSPATSPRRAAARAVPARWRSGGGGRWARPPPHPPAARARHAGPTSRPRRSRPPGQRSPMPYICVNWLTSHSF